MERGGVRSERVRELRTAGQHRRLRRPQPGIRHPVHDRDVRAEGRRRPHLHGDPHRSRQPVPAAGDAGADRDVPDARLGVRGLHRLQHASGRQRSLPVRAGLRRERADRPRRLQRLQGRQAHDRPHHVRALHRQRDRLHRRPRRQPRRRGGPRLQAHAGVGRLRAASVLVRGARHLVPGPAPVELRLPGRACARGDLHGDRPRGDHRRDLRRHVRPGDGVDAGHRARHAHRDLRRLLLLRPRGGQGAAGRGRRVLGPDGDLLPRWRRTGPALPGDREPAPTEPGDRRDGHPERRLGRVPAEPQRREHHRSVLLAVGRPLPQPAGDAARLLHQGRRLHQLHPLVQR